MAYSTIFVCEDNNNNPPCDVCSILDEFYFSSCNELFYNRVRGEEDVTLLHC